MTSTAAILLAGGRIKSKDRAEWQSLLPSGSDNRVMVDIGGKPMYRYVIDAIRGADIQLVIAGDVPFDGKHIRVAGGDSLVDTLLNGIAALPPRCFPGSCPDGRYSVSDIRGYRCNPTKCSKR